MWFKKKPIYTQIEQYGHNTEFLRIFAKTTHLDKIQDLSLETLKRFYMSHIGPIQSMYLRMEHIKYINKFLKEFSVPFVLSLQQVIEITPNRAIIESMETISKFNPTRKTKRNKRIVKLIDESGWSYSEICAEFGLKAKSTVHEIYHREKGRAGLSTA